MTKCWAATYSQCAGGQSKEHLVSRSAFDQKTIFVQGFAWCRNTEVEIGLGSATAKVLCRKHNSLLEAVDRGGASAIKHFSAEGIDAKREAIVDGGLLERWLLKTAINLCYGDESHIGINMTDQVVGRPAPYLLAVAFGDLAFSHKIGAYFLVPSEKFMFRKGEITITPVHKDRKIGGVYFHLRGVDVFLSLYPGHAPLSLRRIGVSGLPAPILDAIPHYRSQSIALSTNNEAHQKISFSWPV
jgi:hypothetical protein